MSKILQFFSENRIIPEFVKYSALRKYTTVKQLDISTAILYLTKQLIHGKCIISLVFAYKILSNHVVKCGTNFLNTLYIFVRATPFDLLMSKSMFPSLFSILPWDVRMFDILHLSSTGEF